MKTELLQSPEIKTGENRINYLWLNGERVIGIEGLEIFQDCRLLQQMPVISEEQRNTLNFIIDTTLEKYCEEGICNYWPGLLEKTKAYFSELGYHVKAGKISLELRQRVELTLEAAMPPKERIFTVADIWNIQRNRRVRVLRRFL